MGDLCSMHKGLAQVFEITKKEIKPSVCNAGNVNRKHSGGVYSINTLDLQQLNYNDGFRCGVTVGTKGTLHNK